MSLIAGGDPDVLAVAGALHRVTVIGDASMFKDVYFGAADNGLLAVNIADYSVPEPATFSFLALGGLALVRRRRG